MKGKFLIVLYAATIVVLTAVGEDCAPVTPPAPGPSPIDAAPPTPGDQLSGSVFDCEADWVESERPNVATPVEVCAAGEQDLVAPCLVQVATTMAHPDTVGCEARDRGARASAAVAAGQASAVDLRVAENIRSWIRSEKVSYR